MEERVASTSSVVYSERIVNKGSRGVLGVVNKYGGDVYHTSK